MIKKSKIQYICPETDICNNSNCLHREPHYYNLCRLKQFKESAKNIGDDCPSCIEYVEPKPELYKCPKADKCVMECYHRTPHEHEPNYCHGQGGCDMNCVPEIQSDIIFFEEDFEIL